MKKLFLDWQLWLRIVLCFLLPFLVVAAVMSTVASGSFKAIICITVFTIPCTVRIVDMDPGIVVLDVTCVTAVVVANSVLILGTHCSAPATK